MPSSYLIFGGSGLLGSSWANSQVLNNDNVAIVTHNANSDLNKVKKYSVNSSSMEEIENLINTFKPSIIINSAGITDIEKCENNYQLAYEANVNLPKKISKISKNNGIKFIHISTDHLFDGKKANYSEEDAIFPLNNYAKTKALAEEEVLKNNDKSLIIRSNFYGWGPKNRKSFSDLIFDNLSNKKEIFLFEDVFFSPLYMKDLINFSNFLLFKNLRGVFNLSSNERISKLDFGKKIARTFNFDLNLIIPTSIEERKDLVLRPKDMSLSNKKFKKYYNEPIDTIEESINKLKKERSK
tara:strand:- start:37598 stop:38488 length:891 start_codon:yes stop_codon:yes gene_type:complete